MNLQQVFTEKLCPVCGCQLDFMPWDGVHQSDEICPCCGIQFGYNDVPPDRSEALYAEWRQRWIDSGKNWWSKSDEPDQFDPVAQLGRLQRFMQ